MAGVPEIPAFEQAPRTGDCVGCGYPVALHFTASNQKLTCAQLVAQLAQAARDTAAAGGKREPLDISGWELVGVAPSSKNADVVYELRREPDGDKRIGCTCTGWTMRWRCRHVDAFIVAQVPA